LSDEGHLNPAAVSSSDEHVDNAAIAADPTSVSLNIESGDSAKASALKEIHDDDHHHGEDHVILKNDFI
jgi:hypothetical protein